MFKLDLQTHSTLSKDGGVTLAQYKMALDKGILDYIAITDHNEIDFALDARNNLGDKIIVGEEIMTNAGEIIGLFLTSKIEPGLELGQTIEQIQKQGGLVYAPHPLDTRRHAIQKINLKEHAAQLDIVEVFNARTLKKGDFNFLWNFAKQNNKGVGVGSDAHSFGELGRSYVCVKEPVTKENLVSQLQQVNQDDLSKKTVSPFGFFAPSINRAKKFFVRK